jgi:hypothetical protein
MIRERPYTNIPATTLLLVCFVLSINRLNWRDIYYLPLANKNGLYTRKVIPAMVANLRDIFNYLVRLRHHG